MLDQTQSIDVSNEATVHQIHDSFTIVQELDVYQVGNGPFSLFKLIKALQNEKGRCLFKGQFKIWFGVSIIYILYKLPKP